MSSIESEVQTRCGFVAIVGRPNVGKSTLMNHMLGQKISITSRKPQTTRHQILGIFTEHSRQMIFVDTPGMHQGQTKAINKVMNKAADAALTGIDVVLMVVEATSWTSEEDWILAKLQKVTVPVVLVINKVDHLAHKDKLLPHIAELQSKFDFVEVIPVSALKGHNMDALTQLLFNKMPIGPFHFDEEQITDKSERFMAAEIIREKIMRQLGAELPYATAVEIERFKHEGRVLHIHGLILVEKASQKQIIIGHKGDRVKKIGQEARVAMETFFDQKIMLNLWIKVKAGWADNDRALKSLGYFDY